MTCPGARYILSFSSLIFRSCQLATKFGQRPNTARPCAMTPIPHPRIGHCTHQPVPDMASMINRTTLTTMNTVRWI